MTYPAWFAFHRDTEINRFPAAPRIYASLVELQSIFFEPRPVKAWVLAEALSLEKETVLRALNLLVQRGYLIEHERGANNVRRFTVALVTQAAAADPNAA